MSIQQLFLGAAAGGDKVYVEEVFSTYLYDGNSGTQTITNGIDLDGEGGMVWMKNRTGTNHHGLMDTERGTDSFISSDYVDAEKPYTEISSFNSNGFTLDNYSGWVNGTGGSYVSWTFRKAPGFFDVVTYTGNSTAGRTVAHSLGSIPGMIIVRCFSKNEDWMVYHRSIGNTVALELNTASAQKFSGSPTVAWNDTSPTATEFTVGSHDRVNNNNDIYVAYLFADGDDADAQIFGEGGDESIVKCGVYTANTSANFEVDLGWEPQYIMIKATEESNNWAVFDSVRGIASGGDENYLYPNLDGSEYTAERISLMPNGFIVDKDAGGLINSNGYEYIYMAIRRGPMKTPKAATEVFDVGTRSGSSSEAKTTSSILTDMSLTLRLDDSYEYNSLNTRLLGINTLKPNSSSSVSTGLVGGWDTMTGMLVTANNGAANVGNLVDYSFKRAPGFFEIVCWSGDDASNRAITHNLGVTPELLITKRRSGGDSWWSQYTGVFGTDKGIRLNEPWSFSNGVSAFSGTSAATSSVFYIGSNNVINGSGDNYIAYLFATCPGVSKIGSFAGTGNDINVDCGFTAGARFVMIKRTDATGDWYVWDTERGIVSGDDPYLLMNETDAEVTNTDYIDPLTTGFTVTASAYNLNDSAPGSNYIYLAIA